MIQEWKRISNQTWCFQLSDEPELIHVIKTGFRDHYMVVHEDAYEFMLGKVEFGTKQDIEVRYKIQIK